MIKPLLIVILGSTGSGKTDLSIELAQQINAQIISADSRQMFKEMPIGSAAPTAEQLKKVKHHFIGSNSIHDYYNVGRFETDVLNLLQNIYKQDKAAILVGGSGLYIDAICRGIDYMPEYDADIRKTLNNKLENQGIEPLLEELKSIDLTYYNQVDKQNAQRVLRGLEVFYLTGKTYSAFRVKQHKERPFHILKIGIEMDRNRLYERINKRVDKMVSLGLENEARSLYPFRDLVPLKTIGYREWFQYFDGDINKEKAIELIKRNTRHYARRQITWFKRYEEIHWFNLDNTKQIHSFISNYFSQNE